MAEYEKLFSTFVLCETTVNQLRALPENMQLKFFWALIDFGIDGIEPELTGTEKAIWIPMRDIIYKMKQKDEKWREKQRENGKKGAEKRWQRHSENSDAIKCHSENSHNNNNNNNINTNNNINIGKSTKKFTPPTLEEVQEYIKEKDYHFDAESFIAYNTNNDWRVKKEKMKDWKQACVIWEKNHQRWEKAPNQQKKHKIAADEVGDDYMKYAQGAK